MNRYFSYTLGVLLVFVVCNNNVINTAILPEEGEPEIACGVPRCDPGCRLESDTTSPCPGCVCDNVTDQAHCPTCDQRYFKHYEARGCTPVFEDGCNCPKRYNCSEPSSVNEDPTVCTFKGQTYNNGDSVPTSNPCEICRCQQNFDGSLKVDCINIECPSMFRSTPLEDGCYDVYKEDSCCPTSTECNTPGDNNTVSLCDFEGKQYQIGQNMYSTEDLCLTCLCNEDYKINGKTSRSCKSFDCALEKRMNNYEKNCIPIYHEKTCCPIEFYCPNGNEKIIPHFSSLDEQDSLNVCEFEGREYNITTELNIHHPTNCVTCTCQTPPDFTCIHKSCPRPPNGDYENYTSIFTPGQCCAKYELKTAADYD